MISYVDETKHAEDGFPEYRRPNNGRTVTKKVGTRNVLLDNRYVVPYNPFLLQRYNCHINVEVCCSVASVKYLFKYIHKGCDRAALAVGEEVDEIAKYQDCRYIAASEACWRILEFPIRGSSHNVVRLPVHLEDRQQVWNS